ncbi:MAG: hypothetical protein K2W96_18375, partial [Gemmataceae bacterium]|nr:hypothetical protein [Gemmataceae bacterium]
QEGGSNLGLIITLVFLVLTTVGLGVTTYLFYSDNEKKDKDKKAAEEDKTKMEATMKWYRFQAQMLRTFMGHPVPGADAKDVAMLKKGLDNDSSVYKSQADYAEARKFAVETLGGPKGGAMPWDAASAEAPSATYESRLAEKDKDINTLRGAVATAQAQVREEKLRADAARKDATDSAANFKETLQKQAADFEKARAADAEMIKKLRDEKIEDSKAKELVSKGEAAVKLELDKLKAEIKKLNDQLVVARKEKTDVNTALDETMAELRIYKDRSGLDASEIESKKLDSAALKEIREWDLARKDWRIAGIGRTGREPYINIGTDHKLQPQVTFSIHSMGKDGRLNPVPKGTLEVVSIKGPRLAQARITSLSKNADKDPILKGDYLFNPTWDPSNPKRVVLAGLADLNEDKSDSTKVLRDLLERQGVEVVGYIRADDPKDPPKMVGGVTSKTDYLVLGDTLEQVNHPRSGEAEFAAAYRRLIKAQREEAIANSVPVITLRKYLDMIGYRAPKLSTTGKPIR